MFQSILMYLALLVIGGLVGRFVKFGEKSNKAICIAQFACLLCLLFFMGVNLGLDEEILKNIGTIGIDASIFSLFTISFSVLGIFIYRKLFIKNAYVSPKEEKNDN